MFWANFVHIYQPPTQTEDIVRKVANESYRKLITVLEAFPQAKLTLNITGCLTDQLYRYGLSDIIDGIGRLAERGQIELTGTAMFHPILPLIPTDEVRRQIELNAINNRRYFGDVFDPAGFFPPEMCYSFEVANIVASMGYRWIIMDEIGFDGQLGHVKNTVVYELSGLKGFNVFFSNRRFSAGLTYGSFPTAAQFTGALGNLLNRPVYLLTATDGEIYGHHRPGQEELLRGIYARGSPTTVVLSELLDLFRDREPTSPRPSSWSTWEDELTRAIPYPQWSDPDNDIHRLQWELTYLAIEALELLPSDSAEFPEARAILDRALHSCQYWWASCRPWWNISMIERGANLLFRVLAQIAPYVPTDKVTRARELADGIVAEAQEWQTSGKARRVQQQYLREHPQVASLLTFEGRGGIQAE